MSHLEFTFRNGIYYIRAYTHIHRKRDRASLVKGHLDNDFGKYFLKCFLLFRNSFEANGSYYM